MTIGSFEANSFFNLIIESSVKCNPFFPGSHILVKCPTAVILASVAGVTVGVGQYTQHDLIRFCDECCAVGYFVPLSLVQRHTFVHVQVWRKIVIRQCIFFAREISRLRQKICVSLCRKIRMDNAHTEHLDIIHTSFCSVYQDSDGSYCWRRNAFQINSWEPENRIRIYLLI